MRGSIDLVATPSHRIVELGVVHVPENRRLFPRMTVEDNLHMGHAAPRRSPATAADVNVTLQSMDEDSGAAVHAQLACLRVPCG